MNLILLHTGSLVAGSWALFEKNADVLVSLANLQVLIRAPVVTGETQTNDVPHRRILLPWLSGGLSQLHSANDAAIAWLTNYGS